jgi:hypothetical protein
MAARGSQAFDLIDGHWRVHNRKLRNVADPGLVSHSRNVTDRARSADLVAESDSVCGQGWYADQAVLRSGKPSHSHEPTAPADSQAIRCAPAQSPVDNPPCPNHDICIVSSATEQAALAVMSTNPLFGLAYFLLITPFSTLTPITETLEPKFITVSPPVLSIKVARKNCNSNYCD